MNLSKKSKMVESNAITIILSITHKNHRARFYAVRGTISHEMVNQSSQMATLLKKQSQHAMATMMETSLSTGTLAQSMSHVKL